MTSVTSTDVVIDVSAIKRVIPHRHPVLLLDRVTDVVPGRSLTAVKAVTCNEPWYAAVDDTARPWEYRYPPTLLVESWCQAAAFLVGWARPNPDVLSGEVMLGVGISGVRFGGPVFPGAVLRHHVRLRRAVTGAAICEGETAVGARTVLSVADFVLALRPADTLLRAPAAGERP
ncbi:beta-hydroxyacyl-ACP dehydratase [Streptomyces cupreus]|uniref:3-hydroxyacyl-ACP dehydratase FabZ family protein n=1 Tax=Streptomyces cupreus TaxID=2759956 RepID=UPI00300C9AD4